MGNVCIYQLPKQLQFVLVRFLSFSISQTILVESPDYPNHRILEESICPCSLSPDDIEVVWLWLQPILTDQTNISDLTL